MIRASIPFLHFRTIKNHPIHGHPISGIRLGRTLRVSVDNWRGQISLAYDVWQFDFVFYFLS